MGQGIVQWLVKLLNVRRNVDRDSRAALAGAARHPTAHGDVDPGLGVRQPQVRVLLVEDDPAVLNATRMLLRTEGYQVTTVLSMANALSQATSDPHIDLLVADYQLGQETGIQLIAVLRELLGQPLKAVLMTDGPSSPIVDFPADPLMRLVNKPVNAEQLLNLMGELLDQSPYSSGGESIDPRDDPARAHQQGRSRRDSGPSSNHTGPVRSQSNSLRFKSTCPRCGKARTQQYDLDSLLRLLDGGYPVEAHCDTCEEYWPINIKQRAALGAAAIKFLMQLG